MDIKMSDLQSKCEKCNGQGDVENPAMADRSGSYGSHLISASPVECDACHGRGFVPTESRSTLLDFLRLANSRYPILF